MRSVGKPPLGKSPIRLRSSRVLRSSAATGQTPGTSTNSTNRIQAIEETGLLPEYFTMSCELQALAKVVRDELGNGSSETKGSPVAFGSKSASLFERGRFYEEYSARRNERLKRKMGETGDLGKTPYKLGVAVEQTKRRDSKKQESQRKTAPDAASVDRRKTVPDAISVDRSENPRYLLRSSTKENKRPPLPFKVERSGVADRKPRTRRVRKD